MGSLTEFFNQTAGKPEEIGFWSRLGMDLGLIPRNSFVEDAGKITKLPELQTLPPFIQNFIHDLKGLEKLEKVNLIQKFVNGIITWRAEKGEPHMSSFSEVLHKNGFGDCDDFAAAKFALLQYAGFPKSDIGILSTTMASYDDEPTGTHALALVHIDGNTYVLDNNFEDAAKLNPDMTATGFPTNDTTSNYTTSQILTISTAEVGIIDGNNTVSIYQKPNAIPTEPAQQPNPAAQPAQPVQAAPRLGT